MLAALLLSLSQDAFLERHCVRCHNADKAKGKFVLLPKLDSTSSAAILERLVAGDMPPEDEPQPDAASRKRMIDFLRAGLSADPSSAAGTAPSDGNHLPHALLFGAPAPVTRPPPPRLWRLGPPAYEGFTRELRSRHAKELPQPFSLIGEPGFKDYAALYVVDGAGTEVLMRNAERLVDGQTTHEIVRDDKGTRVSMAHDTVREFAPLLHPEVPPTREQLETAIRTQFRLALVREPSPSESEALLALYEKGSKVADRPSAARTMLMAPLLTPEAGHRFELGRGADIRPGVRMLSPHEAAFALSLALSDRREPGLFAAAAKGGLASREDVAAHVRRILDDPKIAKPRLLGFFREYFGYDGATEVFKDRPADVLFAPRQMVADTDRLVLHILEKDVDVLRELLTTPKSFVNWAGPKEDKKTKQITLKRAVEAHPVNDKGRKHPEAAYGFEEWPAAQPVELPGERVGILMQPSWLVAWSGNFDNDPVRRGRWIRERLLGGRVPDLPIGIAAKVPDEPHQALRHRLRVTRAPECWKCHRLMDDLGLPFEGFDHYGKPRTGEKVLDLEATAKNVDKKGKALGPVHREIPLSTAGLIAASGEPALDGAVTTPAQLTRKLAGSDRVRQVFIRHVFRYYLGRNESGGDAAALQAAERAYLESQGSFKALLVSLLSSESFLYRSVGGSR